MDERIKMFMNGKIDISFANKAEYDYFMQLCESNGLKWVNGNKPTSAKYEPGRKVCYAYFPHCDTWGLCNSHHARHSFSDLFGEVPVETQ